MRTFPNPIGFYSISLHKDVIDAIQALSVDQLKSLIFDISYRLLEPSERFAASDTTGLSMTMSSIIENSFECINDWLSFMQWVLEGTRHYHN